MSDIVIRDAVIDDAPALAQLRTEITRDPFITFATDEPTAPEMAARVDQIQSEGASFLIAESHGEFLGCAYWTQFRGGPGYRYTAEHSIHLTKASRGRGIGPSLMEALVRRARGAGIRVLVAGISGGNVAGIYFHDRLGFERVGHMPGVGFKNGEHFDLILMQKVLG